MSFSSITRAANDPQLIDRVNAAAHKIVLTDATKADTVFGQQLLSGGMGNSVQALMYPVAIDTEAAYEAALLNLRGAPGFDKDIITDAAITASVNTHWPMAKQPTPIPPA